MNLIMSFFNSMGKGKFNTSFLTTLLLFTLFFLLRPSTQAQVTPGDPNAVPVEFRFHHQLSPQDSGVGINGSWNSWGDVFKMKEVEPGLWKRVLELQPAVYEYKFVTYVDTVGQGGVTGWYTDPLNPEHGGYYNNSFITVKDPMIYYFLPLLESIINNERPEITAKIAVANSSELNVDRTEFTLDGIPVLNASELYDSETKTLRFVPAEPLTFTDHTAELKVFNTAGDSAASSTTFTIVNQFAIAPYTFIFDSKSPNFLFVGDVTSVDIKGSFNFESMDAMTDDDGDGIYTFTDNLNVNSVSEYTLIINDGSYINDPDNPSLSSNHRTQVIKTLDPKPHFSDFSPPSSSIFISPIVSLAISAHISPSDSGWAIDASSLSAVVDGIVMPVSVSASEDGFDVQLEISNPSVGRHVVEFLASDINGNTAWSAYYVFGVYPSASGYHYVDGENDDQGRGTYEYPVSIPAGSADIREFHINATENLDSLTFSLKMENITEFTRIGLVIVNTLDGDYVDALQDIHIRVPEWNNCGVYTILAAPGSAFLDAYQENVLYVSREPLQMSYDIEMNENAESSEEYRFVLPLSILEEAMGNFGDTWHFGAYAYLKDQNGSVEIGPDEGGESFPEDADVYDVAFFTDQYIQERLLGNFIASFQTGGPRIATIGGEDRGFTGVHPMDIDALLGQAPDVEIYASGGDLFQDSVRVVGCVDQPPGTEVTLRVNDTETSVQTNEQREFEVIVSLEEGENRIVAEVEFDTDMFSCSQPIVYNYIVDHDPEVDIVSTVTQGLVTLDASTSVDPDGKNLSFVWTRDPRNPEIVSLSNESGAVVTFPAPQLPGEYYITVTATDDDGESAWVRAVVVVDESGVSVPDYTAWHPSWIDNAVIYEVFVRTFDPAGKFNGLSDRMGELEDLGITCIWLMPIYPSTGNLGPDNPGYAITDYFGILEQYGTEDDFRTLVQTAHQHDIRVILDHVIQHTSALHPFMLDANMYKQHSPYYPFYLWDENDNFQYLFSWVDLASINYEAESTRNYLLRMAKYWIQEFDIDGYRCDVAWAINDVRPSGAAYWQQWRQELKAMKPDILLLAEANAQENLNYYEGKFDAAYDYNWFSDAKNVVTNSGAIENLNATINFYLNPPIPEHALPFRFMENHDEQRFLGSFGLEKTMVAAALLLTGTGIPLLYAGQEVGEETFRGVIDWSDPHNVYPYYKELIDIRKRNRSLSIGDFQRISNNSPNEIYSYLRTYGDENAIVNLNFSDFQVETEMHVPLDQIAFDSTATFFLNDELNDTSYSVTGINLSDYEITLPPYGAQILILSDEQLTPGSRGDVDDNEEINILDVLAVVNHILGTVPITNPDALWRADCNGDGEVNIMDALGIVNAILGIGDCAPGVCRTKLTLEGMDFLRSLESHLSAKDFARLMALVKSEVQIPAEYHLSQNYPNPFNPITTIEYQIPKDCKVSLIIYNMLGQNVRNLVDDKQSAGYYSAQWDSKNDNEARLSSGIYFYTIHAGEFVKTKKMLLLK